MVSDARSAISLNGKQYVIAHDPKGMPLHKVESRPSQAGDPGDLLIAEWRVDGPDFQSFEDIPVGQQAGYLGRDYGDGTDGRDYGIDRLGPLINTTTCSTYDATDDVVQNANGVATTRAWASEFAFVARGTRPAKIDLSDMSLKNGDASLPRPVTDIRTTMAQSSQDTFTLAGSVTDAAQMPTPFGIAVSSNGNYAYVTTYTNNGIAVLDMTDPENPSIIGTLTDATNLANAWHIALSSDDQYAYVTTLSANRLTVVDISDPTAPSVAGSVQDATNLNNAWGVAVDPVYGNYVYVTANSGARLTVVSVTTKTAPTVHGSVNDATNLAGASGVSVEAAGTYVYVAAATNHVLNVVDVSTPSSPSLTGHVTDSTNLDVATHVVTSSSGTYVYVGCSDRLTVVDVSTPGTPTVTGHLAAADIDSINSIALSANGSYVYVTNESKDLIVVVDVTTPASPSEVRSVLGNFGTLELMAVSGPGDYFLVCDGPNNTVWAMEFTPYEIVAGQGDSASYYVLPVADVGQPSYSGDTWAANDSAQAARTFGVAPDRIVAMAANKVLGNELTGAVTMKSPSWATVSTLTGRRRNFRINGFGLDGALWVIGASDGPQMLDSGTGDFFPIIPEIDNDDVNCLQMSHWSFLGLVIPLHHALRFLQYGAGQSFGPETFHANTSPVQGRPTAWAGSTRWGYATIYNESTGDTYLIAGRQRQNGDPGDPNLNPISWFTLAKFSSLYSLFLYWLGTVNGLRTNPTLMGGYGSNAFYVTEPRTVRCVDDSNFRYASSGTTYLTELRRQPGVLKDVEAVEIECSGTMNANKTVTVAISEAGGTYHTVGSAQTSTGHKRVLAVSAGAPDSNLQGFYRPKPRIAYATDSSSVTPEVVGTLRVYYRIRPLTVRVWTITIAAEDVGRPGRGGRTTAEGIEDELYTLTSNAPVKFTSLDRDALYVRVNVLSSQLATDRGGGADSSRGKTRLITLQLTEWQTA